MLNIIVKSPTEVLVDGRNYGAVADTIANNPHLASGIQTALAAWAAEQTAKAAKSDLLITEAKKALADGRLEDVQKAVAKAEKPERESRRAELLQQKADLEAKLDELK